MIDQSDGELMVWDLGTRTGTLVNGVRVSPKAPLRSGDELSFGKYRFLARCQGGAAEPSSRERVGGPAPPVRRSRLAAGVSGPWKSESWRPRLRREAASPRTERLAGPLLQ